MPHGKAVKLVEIVLVANHGNLEIWSKNGDLVLEWQVNTQDCKFDHGNASKLFN